MTVSIDIPMKSNALVVPKFTEHEDAAQRSDDADRAGRASSS